MDIMEFEITRKSKKKAIKRRRKGEKRWSILRPMPLIFAIIGTVSFIISIFFVDDTKNPSSFENWVMLFAFTSVCSAGTWAALKNLTSTYIEDRLNERIWLEGDILVHFWQESFAAGLNYRNTDLTALSHEMDIRTIRDLKYDPKSGRIELIADIKFVDIEDIRRNKIKEVELFYGYKEVFYDYTNPSLIEFFSSKGIPYEETTIEYRLMEKGFNKKIKEAVAREKENRK